jgi:peroxiredoxin
MKVFAERHQLNFPYMWDSTQDVTRSFGVISPPTAFLIDSDGIIRYQGQIDEHTQTASAQGVDYLRNAIILKTVGTWTFVKSGKPRFVGV